MRQAVELTTYLSSVWVSYGSPNHRKKCMCARYAAPTSSSMMDRIMALGSLFIVKDLGGKFHTREIGQFGTFTFTNPHAILVRGLQI